MPHYATTGIPCPRTWRGDLRTELAKTSNDMRLAAYDMRKATEEMKEEIRFLKTMAILASVVTAAATVALVYVYCKAAQLGIR